MPCMGIDLVVKVHYEYSSEREFQIVSQEQSTTSTARNESSKSLAKSKGVVVRQGLKEAGGKIAGLRTGTA